MSAPNWSQCPWFGRPITASRLAFFISARTAPQRRSRSASEKVGMIGLSIGRLRIGRIGRIGPIGRILFCPFARVEARDAFAYFRAVFLNPPPLLLVRQQVPGLRAVGRSEEHTSELQSHS